MMSHCGNAAVTFAIAKAIEMNFSSTCPAPWSQILKSDLQTLFLLSESIKSFCSM